MSNAIDQNKGPFLNDIETGQRFIGYFVLRRKQLETFRDPSRGFYLSLILSDRSGQRLARVWEDAENTYNELEEGQVLKVDGETEEYLDRIQIRVHRVRPAKENEFEMRDMLHAREKDPAQMLQELDTWLKKINDQYLSQLLDYFFKDESILTQFSTVPAAKKVHHAYMGGLLEHVLEMLSIAEAVTNIYPQLNPDLFFTSILLHDIGKLRQFEMEFDIDYTDEGRLVGHIPITDEMVMKAIATMPNFPPQLALELRHIILSHHGRYEWGSPRRPKTPEAVALHYIDNLSAQVNRFEKLIGSTQAGKDWTDFDSILRRQLYIGTSDESNIEEESLES